LGRFEVTVTYGGQDLAGAGGRGEEWLFRYYQDLKLCNSWVFYNMGKQANRLYVGTTGYIIDFVGIMTIFINFYD
jgi:hypothetical protein